MLKTSDGYANGVILDLAPWLARAALIREGEKLAVSTIHPVRAQRHPWSTTALHHFVVAAAAQWSGVVSDRVAPVLNRVEEAHLLRLRARLDRISTWIALPPFFGFFGLGSKVGTEPIERFPWYFFDPELILLHMVMAVMAFGGGLLYLIVYGLRALVRDALTRRLVAEATPPPPYSLFLRSFAIDETLKASTVGSIASMRSGEPLDLRLERALAPDTRLVKIGSRRVFDTAGGTHRPSLTDDDEWFRDFQRLAATADRIVMTPVLLRAGSGTGRELQAIGTTAWAEKTLFIAPGKGPVRLWLRGRTHRVPMRRLWSRSRDLCRKDFGISLPAYPGRSALIVPIGGHLTAVTGVGGDPWDHPRALALLTGVGARPVTAAREAWRLTQVTVFTVILGPAFVASFVALFIKLFEPIVRQLGMNPLWASLGAAVTTAVLLISRRLREQTSFHVLGWIRQALLGTAALFGVAVSLVATLAGLYVFGRTVDTAEGNPALAFVMLGAMATIIVTTQFLCNLVALALLPRTSRVLAAQSRTSGQAAR